jgi:translation initiation factor 2 alpha subunit (eIF-2alpha)
MNHIERIKERRAKRLKQDEERVERLNWSEEKYADWAMEETVKHLKEPLRELYRELVIDEEVIFGFAFTPWLEGSRKDLVEYTPGEYTQGHVLNERGKIKLTLVDPRLNMMQYAISGRVIFSPEMANWIRKVLKKVVPDPESVEINTIVNVVGQVKDHEFIDRIITSQSNQQ